MKSLKLGLIAFTSIGLLFLAACSSGSQENNSTSNTESTTNTAANTSKTEATKSGDSSKEHDDKDHSHKNDESQEGKEHSHGGQVVESGQYHLELVTEKEDKGTHLDFYLKKGEKHEVVSNAQVTAAIQLPDGKQKSIPLAYNADGKLYEAEVSEQATGQYQVKITADVGGEKLNGRFNFNQ
ncbi:hypothetical protein BCD64_00700 [Nostoc sp. MBR 210]|nr:hypothetical protein BCD64_00700 [Nostoc sp. MBR 210]